MLADHLALPEPDYTHRTSAPGGGRNSVAHRLVRLRLPALATTPARIDYLGLSRLNRADEYRLIAPYSYTVRWSDLRVDALAIRIRTEGEYPRYHARSEHGDQTDRSSIL